VLASPRKGNSGKESANAALSDEYIPDNGPAPLLL